MNIDILYDSVEDLISEIRDSNEYKEYTKYSKIVEENFRITDLIESYNKAISAKQNKLASEIKTTLYEIEDYKLYLKYEKIVQSILDRISVKISSIISPRLKVNSKVKLLGGYEYE